MEHLVWLTIIAVIGWVFAAFDAAWWRRYAKRAIKHADDCLALCDDQNETIIKLRDELRDME